MRGHQPLRFKWLKNGIAADGDPSVGVEEIAGKISALTIRKLSAADFGNYTCRVSNAAGADEFTTALAVNGTCSVAVFERFFRKAYERNRIILANRQLI